MSMDSKNLERLMIGMIPVFCSSMMWKIKGYWLTVFFGALRFF